MRAQNTWGSFLKEWDEDLFTGVESCPWPQGGPLCYWSPGPLGSEPGGLTPAVPTEGGLTRPPANLRPVHT